MNRNDIDQFSSPRQTLEMTKRVHNSTRSGAIDPKTLSISSHVPLPHHVTLSSPGQLRPATSGSRDQSVHVPTEMTAPTYRQETARPLIGESSCRRESSDFLRRHAFGVEGRAAMSAASCSLRRFEKFHRISWTPCSETGASRMIIETARHTTLVLLLSSVGSTLRKLRARSDHPLVSCLNGTV